MSRALLVRHWHDQYVNRVWVQSAAGADPDVVRASILTGPGRALGLRVLTGSETLAYLVSQVRRAFAPLQVARAVVLLVVLLGMADTLVAGVSERTRELGIARAVGARPRHLQRMVLAEGLLLATLGLVLASGVGLTLGVLWIRTTFPYLVGWVLEPHVAYGSLFALTMMTAAVTVGAGIAPARRAARLEPAVALRCE